MDDPKRPNVLLVDDDDRLRDVLTARLQASGFNVVSAGTAKDALRVANNPDVPIDVIVMDLVLPDSWGAEVAMKQGLFRPNTKVIFISGYAEDDPILKASTTAEGVHFLPKPFTVGELSDLIRSVLADPPQPGGAAEAGGGVPPGGRPVPDGTVVQSDEPEQSEESEESGAPEQSGTPHPR